MTNRWIWLFALLLAGCQAKYQPAVGSADGYLEEELSPEIFRVHFRFNEQPFFPYTGATFDELVLLRAADLALERGRGHFIVDTNALPGISYGGRSLIIRLFAPPPVAEGVRVYDARETAAKIRSRHPYLAK